MAGELLRDIHRLLGRIAPDVERDIVIYYKMLQRRSIVQAIKFSERRSGINEFFIELEAKYQALAGLNSNGGRLAELLYQENRIVALAADKPLLKASEWEHFKH